MNKEQIEELMMGVVGVMLAYAAYRHFKPAAKASAPARTGQTAPSAPQGVATGEPAPTYTGSPFTALENLLTGTTHDIGGYQGQNYLNDIADPILKGGYNPYDGFKRLVAPWETMP